MTTRTKATKLILGIETSCDETAASVLKDGRQILSNIVSSQIDIHSEYGGIVPEIASRKHVEAIDFVVKKALKMAKCNFQDISAISVTQGPGLVGSLVVGLSYAKACAFSSNKLITGINHIHAHLLSPFLENTSLKFPYIGLVVSGGHTSLYLVKDFLQIELIGKTRDDAAGEAFDKVAKILGLPYPGGPIISRLSENGSSKAFNFPRAWLRDSPFDFSFSGLKTAVLTKVREIKKDSLTTYIPDICASFQEAVVDVLVKKTILAAKEFNITHIAISGGVASNLYLRKKMKTLCDKEGLHLSIPKAEFCTDNAAMVALCGFHQIQNNVFLDIDADVYSRLY